MVIQELIALTCYHCSNYFCLMKRFHYSIIFRVGMIVCFNQYIFSYTYHCLLYYSGILGNVLLCHVIAVFLIFHRMRRLKYSCMLRVGIFRFKLYIFSEIFFLVFILLYYPIYLCPYNICAYVMNYLKSYLASLLRI